MPDPLVAGRELKQSDRVSAVGNATLGAPLIAMNGMHSMMGLGWIIGILVIVLLVVVIAKLLRK